MKFSVVEVKEWDSDLRAFFTASLILLVIIRLCYLQIVMGKVGKFQKCKECVLSRDTEETHSGCIGAMSQSWRSHEGV